MLLWVMGILYFKLLYFDFIWALDSTFSGFQFPLSYITKVAVVAVFTAPILVWRSRWCAATMSLILDIWLVANVMYFRTYFTSIPAASYGLIGNLADFKDSVYESLRIVDIGLPVTTLILIYGLWRTDIKALIKKAAARVARLLLVLFAAPVVITVSWILIKGGFKNAYEDLMYDFPTCGPAVYTIPGTLLYELSREKIEFTPELQHNINAYLASNPANSYTPPERPAPDNVIIILLESFESFPINQTIEGQVITPCINALIAEDSTFYAPKVMTQVGGARSIDAQLILHTGLLPLKYGAYSTRFIHNTYPSLDKAWIENHGPQARAMSFTVDKRTVWNVAVVAQDFGYELYDKPNFVLDVKTGPRGRLGDDSFMRQAYHKIADDNSLWKDGGNTLLQLVTYSGHTPFIIPDNLKKVHFSSNIPERLAHYLEVANYTDRAVGDFIAMVRANPKFRNTMIVITGDHEGMGAPRADYLKVPEVKPWLSTQWFVPFIVVNAPVPGRYDGVMGQVDMYPTLLDMLSLRYSWRGLGQSALDPARQPFTFSPQGKIVGDASRATPHQIEYARRQRQVSDSIISSNFFKYAPIK